MQDDVAWVMPSARLRLTIPEGAWVGSVTRANPEMTIRVLAAFPTDEAGLVLAEIRGEDLESVLEELAGQPALLSFEPLHVEGNRALVQFESRAPYMLLRARESGVPVETPFEIADGEIVWDVTAPSDRLTALGDQLEAAGISFDVESVRPESDATSLLTDTQREVLRAAIDAGYYDTPRRCTLTELSEQLDIAKSTASETLHRAEGKIIKEYAASLDSEL